MATCADHETLRLSRDSSQASRLSERQNNRHDLANMRKSIDLCYDAP